VTGFATQIAMLADQLKAGREVVVGDVRVGDGPGCYER
jgi:hypothetical protein